MNDEMPNVSDPFRFVLIAAARRMNKRHLQAIDYLREENRVLREQLVRLAQQNRDWGYRGIQGALSNLGYRIAPSTVAAILERHGLEPAQERSPKTTWKEFLSWHWELIIELSTRKVKISGVAASANKLWMSQIGRNPTDAVDGILKGKRYLIHDRDPLFTTEFLTMPAKVGVKPVRLPPRSLNLNVYAERCVRTMKESRLDRLILFEEGSLRRRFTSSWRITTGSETTRVWATV